MVYTGFETIINLRNYLIILISLWWCMGKRFSVLPLLAGVLGWAVFHLVELWQGGIVVTISTRPENFIYTTKSEAVKEVIFEIFYFHRLFDITNPYVLRSTFKTYLQPTILPIISYFLILAVYHLLGRLWRRFLYINT